MTKLSDKVVIASINKTQRRALLARSDVAGAIRFGLHFALVLIVAALIAARVPWWPGLLIVQGVALIFLFTALHETIHLTAFRTATLNHIVAEVCGFLVLTPPRWFRLFHFAHHRFTQDPAHDPELATAKASTLGSYLAYMSGMPVWWSLVRGLVVNALGRNAEPFVTDKDRQQVSFEARWYLAAYGVAGGGSWWLGSDLLIWIWWLPLLIGQPFLRGFLLAEHAGCAQSPDMLANSRTTLTNPAVRFVSWNMSWHAEHHALPAVPFHRLPDLHRHTRDHLGETERGYLRFHARHIASLRSSA